MRYANRAKNIKNKAKINEDPKDALLRQFQKEIEELRKQLQNGRTYCILSKIPYLSEFSSTFKKIAVLAILIRPFDLLAPKDFSVIWLSNFLILSIPDEGYSSNMSCTLKIDISIFIFNTAISTLTAYIKVYI